ncbi:MAG: alpha-glucosidase/alpha-galactosidase, partial [Candidatus Bathyarchaeota archaeon]|nr:alpha-glucosidase/alpha-galactosidase [Candidatus Bathyarchaeota archaeon]
MSKPKIVLMGAGSAQFALTTVYDIVRNEELHGSTLSLVDIDKERLDRSKRLTDELNREFKSGLKIESTVDRKEALEGADFIISAVEVDRFNRWKLDCEIPLRYGIKQVVGECGGPGGISHALRIIPIVLDICRDVQDICPDALFINYSNPMTRVCRAIGRYTKVKFVGLCYGVYIQLMILSNFLGVRPEELEGKAAGLNHFSWIMDLRFKEGEDAYPTLRERLSEAKGYLQPLCREIYYRFGFYPSPTDGHIAEFVSFGYDLCRPEERGYEGWIKPYYDHLQVLQDAASSIVDGDLSPLERLKPVLKVNKEGRAIDVINAILSNKRYLELAVNVPNEGHILNLPRYAAVEVPALIDSSGIKCLNMGYLPKGIAGLLETQVAVGELNVEAAAIGSRELALQAMLLDPVVDNVEAAD